MNQEAMAVTDRHRLLLAYTVAELDSIGRALRKLADQGSAEARQSALVNQSLLDTAAIEWAADSGTYIANAEALLDVIADARTYLTERVSVLDDVLGRREHEDG